MTCGNCGSGITADEKFKKLKSGGVNRHVYYMCSKTRDKQCKDSAINEHDLIEQFKLLIDDFDIKALPMREKITSEVQRIKKFYSRIVGEDTKIVMKSIDVREYVKFLLDEGNIEEKRELLGCVKGGVVLEGKVVRLG